MGAPRIVIDMARAIELYRAGLTLDEVGGKLGVSRPTVGAALKAAGEVLRPAGAPRVVDREKLLKMRLDGVSVVDIADKLGVHPQTVYNTLNRMKKENERNPA